MLIPIILTILSISAIIVFLISINLMFFKFLKQKADQKYIGFVQQHQKIETILIRFKTLSKNKIEYLGLFDQLKKINGSIAQKVIESEKINDEIQAFSVWKHHVKIVQNYHKLNLHGKTIEFETQEFLKQSFNLDVKWNMIDDIWGKMHQVLESLKHYLKLQKNNVINFYIDGFEALDTLSRQLTEVENKKIKGDFLDANADLSEITQKLQKILSFEKRIVKVHWSLFVSLPSILDRQESEVFKNLKTTLESLQKSENSLNIHSLEKRIVDIYGLIFEELKIKAKKVAQKNFFEIATQSFQRLTVQYQSLKDLDDLENDELLKLSYKDLFTKIKNEHKQLSAEFAQKEKDSLVYRMLLDFLEESKYLPFEIATSQVFSEENIANLRINELATKFNEAYFAFHSGKMESKYYQKVYEELREWIVEIVEVYANNLWHKRGFEKIIKHIYSKTDDFETFYTKNIKTFIKYNNKKYQVAYKEALKLI
ncbi:hypothetical protein [Mycoplasma sp. Ms02]|uniref:hypothetical protein n=1 Tax=Mycoplasma sp. Ms02 TaxID=353851 RepID=UPI001C8A77EC|nr:hypothetical protein [Mycoplasma sp. Ms02]QZE12174.1 hypothetical protein K4L35_02415 [Mycoplasma sp. Ms02]